MFDLARARFHARSTLSSISRFAYAAVGFASCQLGQDALALQFHDGDAAVVYEAQIARS